MKNARLRMGTFKATPHGFARRPLLSNHGRYCHGRLPSAIRIRDAVDSGNRILALVEMLLRDAIHPAQKRVFQFSDVTSLIGRIKPVAV